MARKPQTKPAAEPKSGLEKVEASAPAAEPIVAIDPAVGPDQTVVTVTPAEPTITPQVSPTYREHQGEWESKKEIAQRSRELRSRQEFADLAKHPKFDKFKSHGGK